MTDHSASGGRWIGSDFRVGRIFDRAVSTYARNFLPFFLVTLAASAAPQLVTIYAGSWSGFPVQDRDAIVALLTAITTVVLGLLSQSVLVYGAFQVLRGKPVNLFESVKVGLRRFFPILGLIVFVALAIFLLFTGMALIVAYATAGLGRYPSLFLFVSPMIFVTVVFLSMVIVGLMLVARWFVVVPICMVERLGPWRSLTRSARLTKGHRGKLVGIMLLAFVPALIIAKIIDLTVISVGGKMMEVIASVVWYAIWSAFFGILVVVTYYELRSATDGADIEQIAGVFD